MKLLGLSGGALRAISTNRNILENVAPASKGLSQSTASIKPLKNRWQPDVTPYSNPVISGTNDAPDESYIPCPMWDGDTLRVLVKSNSPNDIYGFSGPSENQLTETAKVIEENNYGFNNAEPSCWFKSDDGTYYLYMVDGHATRLFTSQSPFSGYQDHGRVIEPDDFNWSQLWKTRIGDKFIDSKGTHHYYASLMPYGISESHRQSYIVHLTGSDWKTAEFQEVVISSYDHPYNGNFLYLSTVVQVQNTLLMIFAAGDYGDELDEMRLFCATGTPNSFTLRSGAVLKPSDVSGTWASRRVYGPHLLKKQDGQYLTSYYNDKLQLWFSGHEVDNGNFGYVGVADYNHIPSLGLLPPIETRSNPLFGEDFTFSTVTFSDTDWNQLKRVMVHPNTKRVQFVGTMRSTHTAEGTTFKMRLRTQDMSTAVMTAPLDGTAFSITDDSFEPVSSRPSPRLKPGSNVVTLEAKTDNPKYDLEIGWGSLLQYLNSD